MASEMVSEETGQEYIVAWADSISSYLLIVYENFSVHGFKLKPVWIGHEQARRYIIVRSIEVSRAGYGIIAGMPSPHAEWKVKPVRFSIQSVES